MPLYFVSRGITSMNVDAVVNAANINLTAGGGVCGAIFKKANDIRLIQECREKAPCFPGKAIITSGYNLNAKYIIHAVGPIYQGGNHQEALLLKSAYLEALNLALEYHVESIAFPLISAGIYGYPKVQAFQIAVETIASFLENYDLDVYLVLFDGKSMINPNRELDTYLNNNYNKTPKLHSWYFEEKDMYEDSASSDEMVFIKTRESGVSDLFEKMNESFPERLFRMIDEKGLSDVYVYKKANISRKLFSKIRSQKDYHPLKKTVLSLGIALELNAVEMGSLLESAGYSLSNSQKVDVIVRYFIEKKDYNLFKINEMLFYYDLPLLS